MWNKVRNNICSGWSICTNNSVAIGGRIWLLWNPGSFIVDILDVSPQSIHSRITMRGNQQVFFFTLVYGYNKAAERVNLWNSLKGYCSAVQGSWLVGGDFNNVLQPNERLGGAPVSLADIKPFQDCLHQCDLQDLKAIGSYYTWNNKQQGKPSARKHSFKYFNMWALDANFKQVVSTGWNRIVQGNFMFQHVKKLKGLKYDLKALNKGDLGDIENKVKVAKLALSQIQMALIHNPMDHILLDTQRKVADELIVLQKAWHMFLDQKAKLDWINMGDDNTHYFHAHIKTRRAKNKVLQIHDQQGNLCTSSSIFRAFIHYYENLLGSSTPVDPVCDYIVSDGPILNMAHHEILLASVTPTEIRNAMFDIGGNKAPGPDGFSSQFYKDTWDITGDNVISLCPRILFKW
ncbi:uncharacterized protein LOC141618348 [Silene latifolia]|uniref:uncharacterized protein LOC141618348 n=1 Tax=Silene latifolia TaxID=37657 RepID=UPI003D77D60B